MEWTTVESEIAYSCAGFDVVHETVNLPGGTVADFDYLEEGESVVILPFVDDETVVIIDEWRQAVDRLNRGLPAGGIEPGESRREAVDRELAEETGYRPGDVEHMVSVEPSNGFADSVFHYYLARGCERDSDPSLDLDETIEASTMAFSALREAVRTGELRDGRSALGVLYYLLLQDDI